MDNSRNKKQGIEIPCLEHITSRAFFIHAPMLSAPVLSSCSNPPVVRAIKTKQPGKTKLFTLGGPDGHRTRY